jgi:hypothetical protein
MQHQPNWLPELTEDELEGRLLSNAELVNSAIGLHALTRDTADRLELAHLRALLAEVLARIGGDAITGDDVADGVALYGEFVA